MALRVCVVVCVTSFLLGILFVHWTADSLSLWKAPSTNENIWIAAGYYSLFARCPSELGYVLSAIVTLGAATILWSLGDGAAGNLMFDTASIFLYGTSVAVYLYRILPTFLGAFSTIPPHPSRTSEVPTALRSEVLNLATGNLVSSVALTGVMVLQAARWWSEQSDPEEEEVEDVTSETTSQRRRKLRRRKNSKLTANRPATSAEGSIETLR